MKYVVVSLTFVVWLVAEMSARADEPSPPRSLLNLDRDPGQVFETPFGKARGSATQSDALSPAFWESQESPKTLVGIANSSQVLETTTDSTRVVPLTKSSSGRRSATSARGNSDSTIVSTRAGWGSTVWSLVMVLAVIAIGARWLKSHGPTGPRHLPTDVFDVLGRKAIDQRTSVLLARVGSRVLVLGSSPSGLRTLMEIDDPVEVDCLTGLCRATPREQNLTATFRTLLHKPAKSASGLAVHGEAIDESDATLTAASRWPDRATRPRQVSPSPAEVRP